MKPKKLLLVAMLALFTLVAAVGCDAQDLFLNQVIRETSNLDSTTETYASKTITEEDGGVTALALSYNEPIVITLSEDTNDLIRLNELRLEVIDLRDQLIDVRESISSVFNSIRTSASSLKELNYVILEDDKTIIQDEISLLKEIKSDLQETSGTAYQRIYDLRGTYTRENLSNIITVFEEVIDVLNVRLELFNQGLLELEVIDTILLDYLEE
ncbi:hypothetical protein ACAG96_01655 [Candidatus Izemoplasma sp. B36]|uniref:hypothetical protein n=1 Tax=Candidatus Izemoplasma sp. B36 TaxID=3242468 RepID=UPI003555E214